MNGMQYCSVSISMVVVLKLVKTLISVNMCGMHSTSVVHRFVKRKLVVKHSKTDFEGKVCIRTCLYNSVLLKSCIECSTVVFLYRW